MRRPFAITTLLLSLGCTVCAWNYADPETFRKTLDDSDFALIAFVAPSDPKSQALDVEWSAAAKDAKGPLLAVDCSADLSICEAKGIARYPTIGLHEKDGIGVTIYQGPKRAGAIVNFLKRSKRPAVSEIQADGLAGFKIADETVFIGFIGKEDKEARRSFEQVAQKYRDEFTFGVVTDPQTMEEQGLKSPAIVCYQLVDRDSKALAAFDSAEALEKLVIEASRPIIGELTPKNHQRLLDRGWPMVYLFAANEAERVKLRRSMTKFAKSYYESLTIVTADPLEFPDLPAKLGLEPGDYPAGAVHQLSTDRIYPYPKGQSLDPKAIQKWGLDVYQGKIKPWTPPGATTSYEDVGPTKVATRRVSINTGWPGVNIKVAGRDEL